MTTRSIIFTYRLTPSSGSSQLCLAFVVREERHSGALFSRIAHEYFTIDLDVVWDIASRDLPVLRVQVAKVLSVS